MRKRVAKELGTILGVVLVLAVLAFAVTATATDRSCMAGDVPAAAPGHEYRFRIRTGDQVVDRIDPYAREVTNSTGNSVVADPDFDWGGDDYAMPPWNSAVIYEMHIGTFNPPIHPGCRCDVEYSK